MNQPDSGGGGSEWVTTGKGPLGNIVPVPCDPPKASEWAKGFDELRDWYAKAIDAAYRKGWEKAREEAAAECKKIVAAYKNHDDAQERVASQWCHQAILAMKPRGA